MSLFGQDVLARCPNAYWIYYDSQKRITIIRKKIYERNLCYVNKKDTQESWSESSPVIFSSKFL